MQIDAAEIVAWSHHLALGYAKHPPLAAWLVWVWFTVFPIHDWSYYLFAILYATFGLWLAWRLYGRLLTPDKRIVALACLTFVPYFNFHGLRFERQLDDGHVADEQRQSVSRRPVDIAFGIDAARGRRLSACGKGNYAAPSGSCAPLQAPSRWQ